MYVDLKKLAKKNCPAGELASFLLWYRRKLKFSIVRKIARMIRLTEALTVPSKQVSV